MRLTIDSFAWIEIIRGTSLGRQAVDRLERADRSITPAIVLAEVALRCRRDGLGEPRVRLELEGIAEATSIAPIDGALSIGASRAAMELRSSAQEHGLHPPGLADGLVLATARLHRSRLLSGDPHFRAFPETLWLG